MNYSRSRTSKTTPTGFSERSFHEEVFERDFDSDFDRFPSTRPRQYVKKEFKSSSSSNAFRDDDDSFFTKGFDEFDDMVKKNRDQAQVKLRHAHYVASNRKLCGDLIIMID